LQEFRSLPDVEKGVLTLQLFVVVALKQAFFSTVLSQLLDERCIETVEVVLKLPKMEIPYLRRYFWKFPIYSTFEGTESTFVLYLLRKYFV